MIRHGHPQTAGFTLIEVLVAIVVVAIGIGALLTTLTSSADTLFRLRDRSFAEWVALNRISETRLTNPQPGAGSTSGEIEYAGAKWQWRQEIISQDVQGVLRIDVSVVRANTKAAAAMNSQDSDKEKEAVALAKAYGFLGTSVSPSNGVEPGWSWPAIPKAATP